ncbi:MAG TPA: two-component regulator propeller domain-containing protein [Candidatus Paceibacterota bacterium]|nr:two-component regulator propeller domain-containing protein [Candidatus Paceibacterota bacterium]
MRHTILFILLALFAGGTVRVPAATDFPSDAPNLRFDRLGLEEGLSHADVRGIVRDYQGFMWLGTWGGGLNRYDGYNFKVYRHDEQDERSLGSLCVWTLHEDRQHTLWVATQDKGLDRYDRATDSFIHYRHRDGDTNSLPEDTVKALYEDEAGAFWVGTIKGLSRFNRSQGTFLTYRHDPANPDSLGENDVRAICLDRKTGLLWVGTRRGGVSVLDRATGRFTRYPSVLGDTNSLSDNAVNHIFQDRAGTLWISTRGGLNRWNPESKSFVRYRFDPNHPDGLSNDFVSMVHEDRMGRLWVATGGGLDLLDRERGTFFHYRHNPSDPTSLSDNDISTGVLYEDNVGTLWIGTEYGGVNRLAAEPEKFITYRNNSADPNSLSQNTVSALCCDHSGNLWVGTGEGLDRFDGQRFVHYRGDPKNPKSQSPGLVSAITEGAEGKLWAGTLTDGLYSFDGTNFTRYQHDPGDPHSLGANRVNALKAQPGGGLWIALQGAGLDFFDGRAFTHFIPRGDDTNSLPSLYPASIFVENAQSLWIGNAPVGLYQFEPARQKFTGYSFESAPPQSQIPGTVVSCFDGTNLWAGSYCGLFCFDLASRKYLRRFTEKDGLANNWLLAVQVDFHGNVWVSTRAGLSKLDVRKGTFRNYDVGDGLQGRQFCVQSSARLPDGRLAFGGVNGLNLFDPERVRDNPNPPPVVLTDFELFNKTVAPGTNSPLKKAIHVADKITLLYDQEVFRLKFAALDYTAPQKNRYAYKLEGFDHDWRYTDASDRSATYTKLNPGNYVFRVKASNNDGLWNEQGTSIVITITPPWWQTWWFLSTATLVALTLAYAGYWLRVRSIEAHNLRLEKEVTERTAQLETANKELEAFSYSVSHDLRAPLRSIDGFSLALLEDCADKLNSESAENLQTIRAATKRMGTLIDDMLRLSKINRCEMQWAQVDLSKMAEEIGKELREAEPQRTVEFVVQPGCVVGGDASLLRIALENIVSNAWKYTGKKPVARIEFGSMRTEDGEVFFVRDNGCGFDMKYAGKLFGAFQRLHDASQFPGTGVGLASVQRVIRRHGGKVWIEGEVDRGTTLYFTLPKHS